MQGIIELLMSNTLYMVAAGLAALFLFLFLLKKVFKIAMMILLVVVAYGGFLYMTEDDPKQAILDKLEMGKSTMKGIDDATKDMRQETLDKVIGDVEKKLKEAADKK